MAISWETLQKRHDELAFQLADPGLDRASRQQLQKEYSRLSDALEKNKAVLHAQEAAIAARQQAEENVDDELAPLFEEEIEELVHAEQLAQAELDELLFPPDERDDRSVFLEIRAGTGGQEAALFALDLVTMYTCYGQRKGWKVSVESSSATDLGGVREVVLYIQGSGVYGHLKKESGVHRVQRVPATETAGRVHTSTATVAVLPEAKEVDIAVNPADLRIDVYRSSGAGGQHVNTTDSAVRITHAPTGVVVTCQEERSQHKNKAKALKILQSRLLAHEVEKQEAEQRKNRKEQVGSGGRAEKVRTYNYPQNRVTDHQVEITLKKLDMVMKGALDEIIDALRVQDRQDRRARFSCE